MKLPLISGQFDKEDSIELLSELIQVKIRFHENKIRDNHNEEDIKMREQKIKQLQQGLSDAKKFIRENSRSVVVESEIAIQ